MFDNTCTASILYSSRLVDISCRLSEKNKLTIILLFEEEKIEPRLSANHQMSKERREKTNVCTFTFPNLSAIYESRCMGAHEDPVGVCKI